MENLGKSNKKRVNNKNFQSSKSSYNTEPLNSGMIKKKKSYKNFYSDNGNKGLTKYNKYNKSVKSDRFRKNKILFPLRSKKDRKLILSLENIPYLHKCGFLKVRSCVFSILFKKQKLVRARKLRLDKFPYFYVWTRYQSSEIQTPYYVLPIFASIAPVSGFVDETYVRLNLRSILFRSRCKGVNIQ